jgi:hypothetical protein
MDEEDQYPSDEAVEDMVYGTIYPVITDAEIALGGGSLALVLLANMARRLATEGASLEDVIHYTVEAYQHQAEHNAQFEGVTVPAGTSITYH